MQKLCAAALFCALLLSLCACAAAPSAPQPDCIAATTYPVWQFTVAVTENTDLNVERVITEPVSCLHDYSLSVAQMKALEKCSAVVISGLGLEDFMADVLPSGDALIDASAGIETLCADEHEAGHDHHGHDHGEADPHIWLDPARAAQMVRNIRDGLSSRYPQYREIFAQNAAAYCDRLAALSDEIHDGLSKLSCRQLVTFHDGFSYFADAFGLEIAAAMEVEAGSEVPAKELEEIVRLVQQLDIPAVFAEQSGDTAAASIVAGETGAQLLTLDMGMSERDYFSAMRHNYETIKGAME